MSKAADILEVSKVVGERLEIAEEYLPQNQDYEEALRKLRETMILRISELIDKDFEHLMWVLYRIDVSEVKLKATLEANPDENAAEMITDMVINRQLEKIETRRKYSNYGEEKTGEADWDFDV